MFVRSTHVFYIAPGHLMHEHTTFFVHATVDGYFGLLLAFDSYNQCCYEHSYSCHLVHMDIGLCICVCMCVCIHTHPNSGFAGP